MKMREDIITRQDKPDKLMGVGFVLQSIPLPFVYWILTFVTIVVAFCIYLFLAWIKVIGIVVIISIVVYKIGKFIFDKYHYVQRENAGTRAIQEQARKLLLTNVKIEKQLDVYDQLPSVMHYAIQQGRNIKFGGLEVSHHLSNLHMLQPNSEQDVPQLPLPTHVRYEDIKHQIPVGHVLVGIGSNGQIETKEKAIGACVWIVGLSGTGKTSTTVVRIEERANEGHNFLGIDPHWFKPDSLSNAIVGYSERFLKPIARNTTEALDVIQTFLGEFQARKTGKIEKPWKKLTLIVDEIGSLMDTTSKEEKELADLLKSVARIGGQEARNFEMGVIYISQQATELAWLRKVALMIIVHQLLMESEKKLAVNGDMAVVEDMKSWPIGRTYVYGVGFQEGPRTVQQPFFEKAAIGQWVYPVIEEIESETVPNDLDRVYEACQQLKEDGLEVSSRTVARITTFGKDKCLKLMNELKTQGLQIR